MTATDCLKSAERSTRTPIWIKSIEQTAADRKGAIVFVDMNSSTALWETIWSLHKAHPESPVKNLSWSFLEGAQNTIVKAFVDAGPIGSRFVKGLGDGFIFYATSVQLAYNCAREAQRMLKDYLRTNNGSIAPIKHFQHISGDMTVGQAFDEMSFRFVIHWTENVIPACFHMIRSGRGRGDWLTPGTGLVLAEESLAAAQRDALLKAPFYPDLFGHDMNYAARCLGEAKGAGIYITEKAIAQIHKEASDAKESSERSHASPSDFVGPRILITVKGISNPVSFFKMYANKRDINSEATIPSYKTKALLIRPIHKKGDAIFEDLNSLINEKDGGAHSKIVPHIFTILVSQNRICSVHLVRSNSIDGNHSHELRTDEPKTTNQAAIVRLEASDQEYLEEIIARHLNLFLNKIDENLETERSRPSSLDTETKFIRTTAGLRRRDPNTTVVAIPAHKWAPRGKKATGADRINFFVMISVGNFSDIDVISEGILRDGPSDHLPEFEPIELLRLWGKPAIYAVFETSARLTDSLRHQAERLGKQILGCTRGLLLDNIRIDVQRCDFASAMLAGRDQLAVD